MRKLVEMRINVIIINLRGRKVNSILVFNIRMNMLYTSAHVYNDKAGMVIKPSWENVVIGTLLGGASLKKGASDAASYKIGANMDSYDFIHDVFSHLSWLCKMSKPKSIDRGGSNGAYIYYRFNTRTTHELWVYYTMFYYKGVKSLPYNAIYEIINPETLAYWIMKGAVPDNRTIYLGTGTIHIGAVRAIMVVLVNKWGIDSNIHKIGKSHRIYISRYSIETIRGIVGPYIIPSLEYLLSEGEIKSNNNNININEEGDLIDLIGSGTLAPHMFTIIGTILGGASMKMNNIGDKARYRFSVPESKVELAYHIFNIFKGKTTKSMPVLTEHANSGKKRYIVETKQDEELLLYYKLFYEGGIKRLPYNMREIFTPEVLAFWLMYRVSTMESTLMIPVGEYSIDDVVTLGDIINNDYDMDATIKATDKVGLLSIPASKVYPLRDIILKYCLPFMVGMLPTGNIKASISSGRTEEEKLRLEASKVDLAKIKEEYESSNKGYPDHFIDLINGLYMAEGTVGAYFQSSDSLSLTYTLSIGQNYSPEAGLLFVMMQSILGGVGKLILTMTETSNVHMKLVIDNREEVINSVSKFNMLYGQKRWAMEKLLEIESISRQMREGEIDNDRAGELIQLVYNMNIDGNKRLLPMSIKLALLGVTSLPVEKTRVDNHELPSIIFIIGFYLGDGSLGFSITPFREKDVQVKAFFSLSQKWSVETVHFLGLVSRVLGVKYSGSTLVKRATTDINAVRKDVFNIIMPILEEHQQYLYWKRPQYNKVMMVMPLIMAGKTKKNMISIANLLYSVKNKYTMSKEVCLERISRW